jgi:anaerobic magnesium-protoporphyrin IX monomethyl ester cyclase
MILLMTTAPPTDSPWFLGKKVPPLGLAYVAANLEKHGFQVTMLDNYMLQKPINEVQQLVLSLKPEIVGITCSSATYVRCVETAKGIKEAFPSCKIVAGGWHPSYVPESMLQHPEIDYVVVGEGERAMVQLATHVTEGRKDADLAKIPGLGYRINGKIMLNERKLIEDMDELPFPARHLLPMQLYDRTIEFLTAKPIDTMNIIRGCSFNCAFCEPRKLWGQVCRGFSPTRVVDEIEHLVTQYGSKGIYFINDNFTIRKKETIEICELIKKRNLDIQWVCDTRADLVSREVLRSMKGAGCKTIWFGVESGSIEVLNLLNRNIPLEKVEDAIRLCKEEGIQTSCSFILGIPGETINDMKTTFKFARKLDPDWCQFNVYVPCPGSRLYEEVMEKHLYDRVDNFLTYVKTDQFDYQKVLEVQRQFHRQFNRSPKRIMRTIRREGLIPFAKRNLRLSPPSRGTA